MKKSAELLHGTIHGSTVHVAQGMRHGEFSLLHTQVFLELVGKFLET
jgi:hypothetical protein